MISARHLAAVYAGPGSVDVRGAGGVTTRGFLEVSPVGVSDGMGVVRQYLTTLRILADTLPSTGIDDVLTVDGRRYRVSRSPEVFDDGAEALVELAGPL